MDGGPSLEVRWILPGLPDTAVAGWFGTSVPGIESREDAYLLRPDLAGLAVKVVICTCVGLAAVTVVLAVADR